MDAPERAVIVACSDCGTEQRLPELPPRGLAHCVRCGNLLARRAGHSLDAALGAVTGGLMLLVAANLLPLMRSQLRGMEREGHLYEAALTYWEDGFWLLTLMVGLFVLVLPLLRSAMLATVLFCVRFGHRPAWLGRCFRYSEELRFWSMPEVFLLAGLVTYGRVSAQLSIDVALGGWAFIGATLLLLLADRSFDRRAVWQAIVPDRAAPAGPRVSCEVCELVADAARTGEPCPRCAHRLTLRKPGSLNRTAALTAAAYLLYVPSYLYPMSFDVRPQGIEEHTILSSIERLFADGFWYFAILIFIVSVTIPLLKLLGLTWAMIRVRWPKRKGLVPRTRVYRMVHAAGRWSNLDPFIVAATAPVMAYSGIADVHAATAALPFALVVSLTQLASHAFDPRLMWDAAERRTDDRAKEETAAATG